MAVPEATAPDGTVPTAPHTGAWIGARTMPTRDLLRSTPARLLAVGVALLLGTLVAGLIASSAANARKSDIDTLLSTMEPLAQSTQNLYSSLSVADAASATAFLAGGVEPGPSRDRYLQSIGAASAELVATSDGMPGNDEARSLLTAIATKLPVYTGLVETARTNSRVGNPVGGAYQSEASSLMQSDILPAARALRDDRTTAAKAPQSGFGRPPWIAIGLLLALLSALVATQAVMARRTRRRFNLGLLFTTAAMAAMLMWMLVAGLLSATSAHRAVREGTEPLSLFATARILAQQARAQEILQLVRREEDYRYARTFLEQTDQLRTLLNDSPTVAESDDVDSAEQSLDAWLTSHRRMIDALQAGDWSAAAATTVDATPDSSTTHFAAIDDALADGADQARAALRADVAYSSTVLSALGPGTMTITLVGAVGIPLGLWPRLREYQ